MPTLLMPTVRRMPSPAGRVAMLSCAAFLTCCAPDPPGEEPINRNQVVEQRPPLAVAEPPLDREQLLLAAVRAASAFAAGSDDSDTQRKLDGKRFELRIRIGCGDAEGQDEARGWRFDSKERTLRLRVTPDISKDNPIVERIAPEGFESVEGLWLRRPWLLTAACPKAPPPAPVQAAATQEAEREQGDRTRDSAALAPPPVTIEQSIGIAQFFTAADSRTARRKQRPYETTKILAEGQEPSKQGYDFVISGRLRALPDRKVIACSSETPDSPPACIISVHVDRAWIERPDNRELIAEWTG